ncbi:MAG: GWxTD domain-containing protein [Chitinophagaceae bacterium]|nr:GWxTD domain-containing protein [Chitinophagaceae bacterium]
MKAKIGLSFFCIIFFVLQSNFLFAQQDSVKNFEAYFMDEQSLNTKLDYSFFDVDVKDMLVNIIFNFPTKETYSLKFTIRSKGGDNKNKERYFIEYEKGKDQSDTLVYLIPFNDTVVKSGNYEIEILCQDPSKKVVAFQFLNFQCLRNKNNFYKEDVFIRDYEIKPMAENLENSFVQNYSVPILQKNILALFPLAQGIEKKVIYDLSSSDSLTLMKSFFYNFWKSRDNKNPEQAWKKYAEQLNVASKLYGSSSTPGYQTDRGRIFITYGKPDKVLKAQNEKGTFPYEVWVYENGNEKVAKLIFLFIQSGMMSNQMMLIHSTINTEIIDPYWKQKLFTDPNEIANKLTHKVYEYFQ